MSQTVIQATYNPAARATLVFIAVSLGMVGVGAGAYSGVLDPSQMGDEYGIGDIFRAWSDSAYGTRTEKVGNHPVATVVQYDTGVPFGHWSVLISNNGISSHTHQVITSPDKSTTRIVDVAQVPVGSPIQAMGTIEISNAAAGLALQQQLVTIADTGPYDPITNSCVSHVSQVLSAAGAQGVPPPSGTAQYRFLRRIVKG